MLFWSFFASSCFAQTSPKDSVVWRDSLAILNDRIRREAFSTDLHLRKAAINIELEQWEYALEEYSFVLSKEPTCLAALYYRGFVYMKLRRYSEAIADYEAFLRIAPKHFEAMIGLSLALSKSHRPTASMDVLNELVEFFPDSATSYAMRAVAEEELKAWDIALLDWEDACRIEPNNVEYVVSKVDLLLRLGYDQQAKRSLDTAVEAGVPRGLLREWYLRCRK